MDRVPDFRAVRRTYPNGQQYVALFAGHKQIGSYIAVNGGFLPHGTRKILPTELAAQVRVIDLYCAALQRQLDSALELRAEVFKQQGLKPE